VAHLWPFVVRGRQQGLTVSLKARFGHVVLREQPQEIIFPTDERLCGWRKLPPVRFSTTQFPREHKHDEPRSEAAAAHSTGLTYGAKGLGYEGVIVVHSRPQTETANL